MKERPWLCPSFGSNFHSKYSFKSILEENLQNVSLLGHFSWCSAKRWILNVWQFSEYIDNRSVIFTLFVCYVLHPTHSNFWHIQYSVFQVYANTSNHIQRYWGMFMHTGTLLSHTQALLTPCVTFAYSQPCHVQIYPSIFRTGGLIQTLWNAGQAYPEPCHIQYI